MNKVKVLIVNSSEEECFDDVKACFIAHEITEVEIINANELSQRPQISSYDLIMIKCDKLSESLVDQLIRFSERMPQTQFIVLSKQISVYAYRKVGSLKNITALQEPFSFSVLESLIKQILTQAESPNVVRFPRFVTNEPARLLIMETGIFIPTRMRNYSPGGAFLEYKGISVRVGQNVKLNLFNHENAMNKNKWQLNALVIWTREGENRMSSARGLGVKFHEEEEEMKAGSF